MDPSTMPEWSQARRRARRNKVIADRVVTLVVAGCAILCGLFFWFVFDRLSENILVALDPNNSSDQGIRTWKRSGFLIVPDTHPVIGVKTQLTEDNLYGQPGIQNSGVEADREGSITWEESITIEESKTTDGSGNSEEITARKASTTPKESTISEGSNTSKESKTSEKSKTSVKSGTSGESEEKARKVPALWPNVFEVLKGGKLENFDRAWGRGSLWEEKPPTAWTHYDTLEIPDCSSDQAIEIARRELIRQWHPDRFSGEAKVEAVKKTTQINYAHDFLLNWEHRCIYDVIIGCGDDHLRNCFKERNLQSKGQWDDIYHKRLVERLLRRAEDRAKNQRANEIDEYANWREEYTNEKEHANEEEMYTWDVEVEHINEEEEWANGEEAYTYEEEEYTDGGEHHENVREQQGPSNIKMESIIDTMEQHLRAYDIDTAVDTAKTVGQKTVSAVNAIIEFTFRPLI
ncbi:hypothetical protein F5Y02DRAFT_423191 [Annulohypoxylon stygium]|nr:hypothetical protein F5Y02DRAFT_423191 [Annulohypoxylon stygium]